MSLTIPDSLKVQKEATIAIKANDWNTLNQKIDNINEFYNELKQMDADNVAANVKVTQSTNESTGETTYTYWYKIENTAQITSISPIIQSYSTTNYPYTKQNSGDLITAKTFNQIINKLNALNKNNQIDNVNKNDLIKAETVQKICDVYLKLPISITITAVASYLNETGIGTSSFTTKTTFSYSENS